MNGTGRYKDLGTSFDIKRPNKCNMIISAFMSICGISPSFPGGGRPSVDSEGKVMFYKGKGRVGLISLMGEESSRHVRRGTVYGKRSSQEQNMPQFAEYAQAINEGRDWKCLELEEPGPLIVGLNCRFKLLSPICCCRFELLSVITAATCLLLSAICCCRQDAAVSKIRPSGN